MFVLNGGHKFCQEQDRDCYRVTAVSADSANVREVIPRFSTMYGPPKPRDRNVWAYPSVFEYRLTIQTNFVENVYAVPVYLCDNNLDFPS